MATRRIDHEISVEFITVDGTHACHMRNTARSRFGEQRFNLHAGPQFDVGLLNGHAAEYRLKHQPPGRQYDQAILELCSSDRRRAAIRAAGD